MKAFHGDPAIKAKYLSRLKAHHVADEIIQGQGWDGSHGCAVGCTLNKYAHEVYETELGLPQWLAHLEDRIFEGLPPKEAQQFAVDFLEAIPVGANVEEVRWQLASQRHMRDRDRLMSNPEPYAKECIAALDLVIAYCDSKRKSEAARSAARSAAQSAAVWSAAWAAAAWSAAQSVSWSAARSAARSARSARSAARSAAQSAAVWSAAQSASWSAAWAAASWSARSDHFKWEAATLLELLRNAPQES
jgi:hypothetical protein